jgi:hypothetical protein
VLPDLADTDLWDLLAAVTSDAAGLHQIVHPPPTLAALYRQDPQLGHANVEFAASADGSGIATAAAAAPKRLGLQVSLAAVSSTRTSSTPSPIASRRSTCARLAAETDRVRTERASTVVQTGKAAGQ